MKKIIIILIIIFYNLNISVHADDIKDFEIEGISVGDSLLDFLTSKKIKSSKRNYVKDKKYYAVGYDKNLKKYETVDIYLKSGDIKYTVVAIVGFKFINMNECLNEKKVIVNQIKSIFTDSEISENPRVEHMYDKTGDSYEAQTNFLLNKDINDDHIRVGCTNWSEKITNENNWADNLAIGVYSKEIQKWFIDGYN
jgi:hypothetical protein